MTSTGLINRLRSLDIRVSVDRGKLHVSAPQGVLSPELQAELARLKPAILAAIEDGQEIGNGRDWPPLVRKPRDGDVPLSFAQQRLWFLDQFEPGTADYTIAARRKLGAVDPDTLREAFTQLVRRHEALRTTFPTVGGRPVQRIHDAYPVEIRIVDLSDLPEAERAEAAEATIAREAKRPFDLARGPLVRPCLVRLSPDEHEMLVAIHHIVADGWSVGLIAAELRTIHEALLAGDPIDMPEPPIQYADYVSWQRQRISGQFLEAQTSYWREQLAELPPALELPTDHPRRVRARDCGAARDFAFPPNLRNELARLARHEGATLFMIMLAAFDVLIARWTGRADIIVGSPIANRGRAELEGVVGFFANTLVLRSDLSGDPTFRALLGRVRESCVGAYEHQDMPFEKLVEELQPERRMGRNPIFQVSFVLQSGATGGDVPFVAVAAPFDITLYVRELVDGQLSAAFEYRPDLFEAGTIDRMAWQYCRILEAIVAGPDRPISTLPILSADEREQMLAIGTATATPYPRNSSVHALFEDRVDAAPNAVALQYDGATMTYSDLDGRANRLAHHLIARGVAPDDVVGVCMERSIDAIVALLAVLKTGAAFVPLDLFAPPARLAFVLRDAGARFVVAHSESADRIPAGVAELVRVDSEVDAIAASCAQRPHIARTGDDLAYVMYTSGTSGQPKGVAVPHRGIVRLVRGADYADFGADQVFLQYAPLSFDASTFEIWGALLNGAVLAVAPPGALSLEELDRVLERERVTTLWLTAPVFHQAALRRIGMFRGLRQLLAGGDVLSPRAVRAVLEAWPGCRLINGYGPTENTTFSCCSTVRSCADLDRTIPIGSPIANSRAYILDPRREPVPFGVPGELWLAGDGLALGYLRSPELTAERFIVHRFSADRVERLYRTGDRARWLADGTIEFLGRVDQQVKLRGFRIEPAEIEATLRRQQAVREAAVIVRGNGDQRQLVAYVAPVDLDVAALRDALRTALPDYMVPSAIITLDRLPTNANGKLDRAALPEPVAGGGEDAVAPRNDIEQRMLALWEDVLDRPGIGVRDDFFELGGHSLMAVELFARIELEFGVALPLATLFRSPTIEAIARLVAAGQRPATRRSLVPIRMEGHRPPLFAVPGVGGNVLCFHELAAQLAGDRPFFGLQSRGLNAGESPLHSVEDIARAFITEIREVQPAGPYHLIGGCMGGVVAFEMACQLHDAGEDVGLLGLLETWPPGQAAGLTLSAGAAATTVAFAARRLADAAVTLRQLRGRARLQYVRTRLGRAGRAVTRNGSASGMSNDKRMFAVERSNQAAVASYKPPPYDGDAVLFLAAERRIQSPVDPRLGWRDLVAGRLDVLSVPGEDSGLMLHGNAVRILADRLQQCLDD